MRTITSLFLVAVAATATFAAPASRATDWAAVESRINEIQTLVLDAGKLVSVAAGTADTAVSNAIDNKLILGLNKCQPIWNQANAAVASQTLDIAQVKSLNGNLKGVVGQVRGDISPDLKLLQVAQAQQIRDIFDQMFLDLNNKQKELIVLLAPSAGQTLAIDWSAVEAQVGLIGQNLNNAKGTIENALQGMDAQNVLINLENTAGRIELILRNLGDRAESQILTKAQVGAAIGDIKGYIGTLRGLIARDLAAIPPQIANQVRESLNGAQRDVGTLGGQLNKLLSA